MKYDTIFIDFDGTLFDSSGDICDNINRTRQMLGLDPMAEKQIKASLRKGFEGIIEDCYAGSGLDFNEAAKLFNGEYIKRPADKLSYYPGVKKFLEIDRHPKIILSNKLEALIIKGLEIMGASDCFDGVIGADTIGVKKPHPKLVDYVIEKHAPEPGNCLMIGDDTPDFQFAEAAGMDFVFCNFGFRKGEFPGRFKTIDTFDEIYRFIA